MIMMMLLMMTDSILLHHHHNHHQHYHHHNHHHHNNHHLHLKQTNFLRNRFNDWINEQNRSFDRNIYKVSSKRSIGTLTTNSPAVIVFPVSNASIGSKFHSNKTDDTRTSPSSSYRSWSATSFTPPQRSLFSRQTDSGLSSANQIDSNLKNLVSTAYLHSNQSSSTIASNHSTNGTNPNSLRNVWLLIGLSSILLCLIFATIIGNVFVISAVVLERSLRTVGNYLVVSLAITDLLVACLVMPIGAIYEVTGQWNMGVKLCELWTFIDVLCCTTSIFHLLAIACDRLWAVTHIDYIHRRKTKHVCFGIAIIWLFSTLISLGPMLGWKDSEFENRIIIRKECMISQDLSYQIFATIASFYGPSIILLFQYYRIYQVAKARLKMKKQRYQYRIRRRPSFYRTRKESEIKEFPRMAHRVSINPNEEFISSASTAATLPQQSSTSGVYSSSTATEMTTTATTNTTLSTEGTSSVVTINPRKFSKPITSIGSIHDIDFQRKQSIKILTNQNRLDVGATNANEHHKRFSIVQFFTGSSSNEHRKRSDSNLDGERFRMARFDELIDNNDLQSNESSLDDDSTIIIDGPDAPTNIVIYVDDYESTACSSCDATDGHRHSTLSFYRETEFMTTCDEDDDDDEEDDDEDEEIGTNENDDDDDDADENGEESREITETPVKTDQTSLDDDDDDDDDEKDSEKKKSDQQSNVEIIVPELVIQKRSSLRKDDRDDPHHHHHHHHHHHRKLSKSQKRRRRIRKLKFRNKILRFDNGGSSESKQESKAAKTLTIITGVFIICWLPFFVMALVMPLCGDRCHINKYLFDFFVWLGWANSTLNPFLYTIFSPDFRNAFQKLLKRVKNK